MSDGHHNTKVVKLDGDVLLHLPTRWTWRCDCGEVGGWFAARLGAVDDADAHSAGAPLRVKIIGW